jgi:hypothetical protein
VIFIGPVIKEETAFPAAKGANYFLDNFFSSALTEVGNTFDQLLYHLLIPLLLLSINILHHIQFLSRALLQEGIFW